MANFSWNDPESLETFVRALRVNANAIVLMDSDRRKAKDDLKDRVNRVTRELEETKGLAWITAGREVENYIPVETLRRMYSDPNIKTPPRYSDVLARIRKLNESHDVSFNSSKKTTLARQVVDHLKREDIAAKSDLAKRMDEVCAILREWNGLPCDGDSP